MNQSTRFGFSDPNDACPVTPELDSIQMALRILPLLGILVALILFGVAASLHPGGFDWNRDYLSTLLRADSSPARTLAIAGMLVLCASIACVFQRLARAAGSSRSSKVIQIGGIGSMIYASLAFTPMHDLMVAISLIFFLAAVLALLQALYLSRRMGFLATGSVCLVVLLASATMYYAGEYVVALPWAQRASFALFSAWLVSLDFAVPRLRPGNHEPA